MNEDFRDWVGAYNEDAHENLEAIKAILTRATNPCAETLLPQGEEELIIDLKDINV